MVPSIAFDRTRGISPVVGVVLLVAIVVILASTVGVFVLGLAEEKQTVTPTVVLSAEYDDAGPNDALTLTAESGDVVPASALELRIDGAGATFDDDLSGHVGTRLRAGDSVTVDASTTSASSLDLGDATVRLVWEDGGTSDVLWTWTAN